MKSGLFSVLAAYLGTSVAFTQLPRLTKEGRKNYTVMQENNANNKDIYSIFQNAVIYHSGNLSGKHGKKYVAGTALVALAIIAGIVYSNVKGKKKQGKMILQVACDEWNADYPDQKININDITKLVSKNKDAKKIMTSIKKSKPDLLEHAFKTDKLMEKHGEFHHNSK